MQDRNMTPLDRFLSGVNDALTGVTTRAGRSVRPNPAENVAEATLNDRQKSHAAGLMRVNHAGRHFDIQAVKDIQLRGRELQIMAKEYA